MVLMKKAHHKGTQEHKGGNSKIFPLCHFGKLSAGLVPLCPL